jgi:adenine phosphoribosyltransferase
MAPSTAATLQDKIVDVPDFPKPGIVFKDITPILLDPESMRIMVDQFAESIDLPIDKIAAVESRGFLIAAPLAHQLEIGLVLIRKKGKLPRQTIQQSYGLEYGEDIIEVQEGDIKNGDRVMIVDDVLATGGTAHAAELVCKTAGAEVVGFRFLMNLKFLNGEQKLTAPIQALIDYYD